MLGVVDVKYCSNCGKEIIDTFCDSCSCKENNKLTKDMLLKLFAGKNWNKIYNSQWNWSAFFFGFAYYLYRKLWLSGFVILVITILINFLTEYFCIPTLISILIFLVYFSSLAIIFPGIYTYYSNKVVDKMLASNLNYEECQKKCKKSGGTSTFIAITLGSLGVIFFIFYFLLDIIFSLIINLIIGL